LNLFFIEKNAERGGSLKIKTNGKKSLWKILCAPVVGLLLVSAASAATFAVTNTDNSGAGSLRQAIIEANAAASDDIIVFDPSVFNVSRTRRFFAKESGISFVRSRDLRRFSLA
jgi:hypothetical protein